MRVELRVVVELVAARQQKEGLGEATPAVRVRVKLRIKVRGRARARVRIRVRARVGVRVRVVVGVTVAAVARASRLPPRNAQSGRRSIPPSRATVRARARGAQPSARVGGRRRSSRPGRR
eukprot:scaffold40686_cov45-Phaeocystis_antarctica.AAC.3